MSLNFADLVILGDDLSGIAAGGLLAKRGFNVLVVDRPCPDETVSLPGLDSRIFKSIIGKLGIPESRLRGLTKNKTNFQIILPEHRIDIKPEQEDLFEELCREFPKQDEWIREFFSEVEMIHQHETLPLLKNIPWASWKEKRHFLKKKRDCSWPTWVEVLEKIPIDLQAILKAWIQFLADNPVVGTDSFQPFSLLTEDNSRTVTIKGGLKELKQIFYEKIEYFGGTILQEPPENYLLETESNIVKGIQMEGYHFMTHCRYLFGNGAFSEFVTHVPKGFRTRRYRKKMEQEPAARALTIHFVADAQIIPDQMCQNVLFIKDPAKPLLDSNYFQIHCRPILTKQDKGDEDQVMLSVRYFLPPDVCVEINHASVDAFERRHEAIEQSLKWLIPFSEGKLHRLAPKVHYGTQDLFDRPTDDYQEFFNAAKRNIRYTPSFSFPNLVTPYQNLYALGQDQLGWLGLEGRLHGAMKVIDCIWEKEEKRRSP
jgi:hypothetical protein